MVETIQRIGRVGSGEVYQAFGSLDGQIERFKDVGISPPYLASPEQVAEIRVAGVSQDFSRTSMLPIATKGAPTILLKDSFLMNPTWARIIVRYHNDREYLSLPNDFYQSAEATAKSEVGKQPEDRSAIILPFEGYYKSLNSEMDETRFILGAQTDNYFGYFGLRTIPFFNLVVDSKDSIVNYLGFQSPPGGSGLYCVNRDLYYHSGAFGVLKDEFASV
ncbi:MAG: hypothetical protein Q8P57_03660 [Candidatus Pacearchaeota archaeon]|nr:hypothetical protein [Candidatus Pacearchaeota archaeon]